MTEPIKGCPQPDAPELVMRADGYHYKSEDEMKELTFDQLDEIWEGLEHQAPVYMARAAIAADRALNAADRDVMRQAPEGWKLVPIEPTKAMVSAAQWEDGEVTAMAVWRQMIAEAPTPSAEQQGEQEPVTTYARQHAAHEAELTAMIAERDHREEIIDQLCDAVLGQDRTEWSSNYYFEDAVAEVQERILELEERKACHDSNSPVLPSSALVALRAKVEALPIADHNGDRADMWNFRRAVLAEIDKLGGGV